MNQGTVMGVGRFILHFHHGKVCASGQFPGTYMLVPGSWSGLWGLGDLSRLVRNDYSSNASLRLSLSTFALPPRLCSLIWPRQVCADRAKRSSDRSKVKWNGISIKFGTSWVRYLGIVLGAVCLTKFNLISLSHARTL